MQIDQILPIIFADKSIKKFIEDATKQPADYVGKCLSTFFSDLKGGPGLTDKALEQKEMYNSIFQAGISMGFPDYECVIAASGYAGYSPIDVVTFFRNNYGWNNLTVEEVETLAKNIAPKFKDKLIKYGYIKEDQVENNGIPKLKENKNYGSVPPWRSQANSSSISDAVK